MIGPMIRLARPFDGKVPNDKEHYLSFKSQNLKMKVFCVICVRVSLPEASEDMNESSFISMNKSIVLVASDQFRLDMPVLHFVRKCLVVKLLSRHAYSCHYPLLL